MGLDAYQMRKEPIVNRVLKTIDESFNGNDIEFLNTFMDERYRDQIKIEIAKLQRQGKEVNLQELILDYELYFTKLDSWKEILNTYYGVGAVHRTWEKKGRRIKRYLRTYIGKLKTTNGIIDC